MLAHRTKKNFPANGSHHVSKIDKCDCVEDMQLVDLIGLAPECDPVKITPGAELHIYKQSQNGSSQSVKENLFSGHEWCTPKTQAAYACVPNTPMHKVNDANARVNGESFRWQYS